MMSLTLYLCRMNTFSWPNALYILSASPRDREYSLTSHKMLVKWAIRLPNQFLSHNILLQSKNQAKVAYFTKLVILIFWCPEETRITNFTRIPLCNAVDIHQGGDKRKFPDSKQYLTQHACCASDLCDTFVQTKEHKTTQLCEQSATIRLNMTQRWIYLQKFLFLHNP